jgi:hypothetical protein
MTRRRRLQPRRIGTATLDANAELIAVGYRGWWVEEAASRRAWWQGIATVHGDRLRAKWVAAFPGTRPAFDWVTRLPAWGLVREPDTFDAATAAIEVGGVRYWYCGSPWQRPQADVLRDLGEIDAAEHRRHREWINAGASSAYRVDEGWDCEWIAAGATGTETFR